jgi:hypothetical protein
MPRPKLTEEEYKARKQQRNKQYYQKVKDVVKEKYQTQKRESIIYIIKGLENDKSYVGVSNVFESRQKKHTQNFGDVNIEPFLRFTTVLPVYILNLFESLIMHYYVGADKCLNIHQSRPDKDRITSNLQHLDTQSKNIVLDCLKKMESSGNPDCGLND